MYSKKVLLKLILVGDASVGKSSLLTRYVSDKFVDKISPTIGADFATKQLNNVTLQIWDTAGAERFNALGASFWRGADGILLVFDVTNKASFTNLQEWMDQVEAQCGSNIERVLVGNKCDSPNRVVSFEQAQAFASKYDIAYCETSARSPYNVIQTFEQLVFGGPVTSPPKNMRHVTGGVVTDLTLSNVKVVCEIRDIVASVVITHVYNNIGTVPQELIVGFPIEDSGSVCKFEAINSKGRRIVGKVLEKHAAAEKYDNAIAEGKTTILLEELPGNIFRASIGMLPPGESMTVEITYVSELQVHRAGELMFFFKTQMNTDATTVAQLGDAARIKPVTPADTSLSVKIYASDFISSVTSPSHKLSLCHVEGKEAVARVDEQLFAANLELVFAVENPYSLRWWLEYNPLTTSTAAMVSLVPFFPKSEQFYEFIFLVDRSGSMMGEFWKEAANALHMFLRSLPEGSHFEVIGFGTRFESIFSNRSVPYNDENLAIASRTLNTWFANMGGTEILKPLRTIYTTKAPSNTIRRVIVLTDGQVNNTEEIIRCVKENTSELCETYCMGIGSGVDKHLVTRMAEVGRGFCEFSETSDSMQLKVVRQLKRAVGLDLVEVKVAWGDFPSCKFQDVCGDEGNVFVGGKMILYTLLDGQLPSDAKIKVNASISIRDGRRSTYEIELDASKMQEGNTIHPLAAKHFVTRLTNIKKKLIPEPQKADIVSLCTRFNISSVFAHFVAVDETVSGKSTMDTMEVVSMTITDKSEKAENTYFSGGILANMDSSEDAGIMPMSISLDAYERSSPQSSGCCGGGGGGSTYTPPPTTTPSKPTTASSSSSSRKSQTPQQQQQQQQRQPTSSVVDVMPEIVLPSLNSIVQLQLSNGSWEMNNTLTNLILVNDDELDFVKRAKELGLKQDLSGVEEIVAKTCWATALVYALLQLKFKADKEKWELMAEKSLQFLEKNITRVSDDKGAETWVLEAKKVIGASKKL